MKYFDFDAWSISYNYSHDATRNETHCGFDFIAVILTEIKTTRKEIIWKETSTLAFILSKQKWLAFTEWAT